VALRLGYLHRRAARPGRTAASPGITSNGGGTFGQASDASVAFDARDDVWMISSLGISGSTVDVLVSRSTNGGLTSAAPPAARSRQHRPSGPASRRPPTNRGPGGAASPGSLYSTE